jgi:hypothetical protein
MTMPFPKFVSVEGSTSPTGQRADRCTFLSTREPTDACTAQGGSGDRQFVAMFLPESAMTTMTPGRLSGADWPHAEGKRQEHQDDRHEPFQFAKSHSIYHEIISLVLLRPV